MSPFLVGVAGVAAGALAVSAYRARRDIAREWRWALRDLAALRTELAGYIK